MSTFIRTYIKCWSGIVGKCRGGLSSCIRHFLAPAYSILQLDAICFVWFIFVVNGTRSFATVFTKYRQWTPSSTRWVKVTTVGRVLFLDFLILSPPVNTAEQADVPSASWKLNTHIAFNYQKEVDEDCWTKPHGHSCLFVLWAVGASREHGQAAQ